MSDPITPEMLAERIVAGFQNMTEESADRLRAQVAAALRSAYEAGRADGKELAAAMIECVTMDGIPIGEHLAKTIREAAEPVVTISVYDGKDARNVE